MNWRSSHPYGWEEGCLCFLVESSVDRHRRWGGRRRGGSRRGASHRIRWVGAAAGLRISVARRGGGGIHTCREVASPPLPPPLHVHAHGLHPTAAARLLADPAPNFSASASENRRWATIAPGSRRNPAPSLASTPPPLGRRMHLAGRVTRTGRQWDSGGRWPVGGGGEKKTGSVKSIRQVGHIV
jgi:hypothetical protein